MKMISIPITNYRLSETVVTQKQWRQIMNTEPWKGQKYVREGDDYPAVHVSWNDAVTFCEKLSEIEGRSYRLPTAVEWEYACRAGVGTSYHFGDNFTDLSKYAWFRRNTWDVNEKYAHSVAKKLSNQFGLYDMHGNVWEWCSDWYDEDHRMLRGGSWYDYSDLRSACFRSYGIPKDRGSDVGFRLASIST